MRSYRTISFAHSTHDNLVFMRDFPRETEIGIAADSARMQ